MLHKRSFIIVIPIFLLALWYSLGPNDDQSSIQISKINKQRGVCWVGGRKIVDIVELQKLTNIGVNWISQTPFGWQRGHDSPMIGNQIGSERGWWGERDEGLRETTRMAKSLGINTILKPHIWLRDEEGKWRGEIEMNSEEDWQMWFKNYETFILHYAQLAEEEGIEMLCIGTELHRTCTEREMDWRDLIKKIRSVYSGDLTYAANFADEYEEVAFWDELDMIGIQGYFPIVDVEHPTKEQVLEGWQKHIEQLRSFSNAHNKPILFTEIGYKSTKEAGISPWEWPQRLAFEEREALFSEETQATLYDGMFETLFNQPFIAGFHLWKWYPFYEEQIERFRVQNPETNYVNIDFTPQGKLAEDVMSKWFTQFQ